MRQIVNEIVHRNTVGERGVFLGIQRVVGVLPGVAQIHVVENRDHDASLVVADAAPMRRDAGRTAFIR